MTASLIGGMIRKGHFDPTKITVSEPDKRVREALQERFSVMVTDNNRACAEAVDVVLLAVKPQIVHQVAAQLMVVDAPRVPLFISIAAGIRVAVLRRWLETTGVIVRAMPNTPALIGLGATGMYVSKEATLEQRQQAETIMNSVGITIWVEQESDLDAVTAISGSGPAYYFQLMEWMLHTAKQLGLSDVVAKQLVLQTALGASHLAIESSDPLSVLRERITSPGGTTEAALQSLHRSGVARLVSQAVIAAHARAEALGDALGDK